MLLFPGEVFGFADLAADFACTTFDHAFGFHAAVADQPANLLLGVTFNLSRASARPPKQPFESPRTQPGF